MMALTESSRGGPSGKGFMARRNSHRRLLIALALAGAAAAVPASAQVYFNEPGPPRDFFSFPFFGGPPQPAPNIDYTRAPATRKLTAPPGSTVVVIGDSMADWLGYGLDDTYADQPEIGVDRLIHAYSGLVRYDPRSDTLDWSQAVKDALASEKPSAIVVMLGLNDRLPLRAALPKAPDKDKEKDKTADKSADQKNANAAKPGDKPADKPADKSADKTTAKPGDKPADKPSDKSADQASKPSDTASAPADSEAPQDNGPGGSANPQRPVPGVAYDFHTDQWAILYAKRIDEMIAALKTKGVPVLWVGLPSLRGQKSTSDMAYLNELYRERAERAGIIYVDIWDGFVDDQGRFTIEGPDFQGQIRRLRTPDGVHFTEYGAVKLASYVDQELRRVMTNHIAPIALPEIGGVPAAKPGAPHPDVGPVVPLTVSSSGPGGDLAGANNHPAPVSSDPLASKVLDHGDPIAAVAGRADDFSWPRPAENDNAVAPPPQPVSLAPDTPAKNAQDQNKKPGDAKTGNKPVANVAPPAPPKPQPPQPQRPAATLDGASPPRPPASVPVNGGY
jgi:uncharacterized protein